jgi:hypothetical protein
VPIDLIRKIAADVETRGVPRARRRHHERYSARGSRRPSSCRSYPVTTLQLSLPARKQSLVARREWHARTHDSDSLCE